MDNELDITSLHVFLFVLFLLAHGFLVLVFFHNTTVAFVLLTVYGKVYSLIVMRLFLSKKKPWIKKKIESIKKKVIELFRFELFGIETKTILIVSCLIAFYAFILAPIIIDPVRLRSIGGYLLLLSIAAGFSVAPKQISLRPVVGGVTLQLFCGALFLRWEAGNHGLQFVVDQVVSFLDLTHVGTKKEYGFIVEHPALCNFKYVFIFDALQVIIFFGAIVAVLYHLGVIQAVLIRIAFVMKHTVGTSAGESFNAAACIFLGQTEAALLVSSVLPTMTDSELHAVMTAGFACIAGSLFSAFVSFGACPSYLMTATVMSASVSLAVSKILYPETEDVISKELVFEESEEENLVDCISSGAVKSSRLVLAIGANLVAFLAILGCINCVTEYLGDLVGFSDLSLNTLLAYALYPITYMMGVSDSSDPEIARNETFILAELLGIKTVLNEFIAYERLSEHIRSGTLTGKRARMMATFACCGFSNFGMIGSMLGVLNQLIPQKRAVLANMVLRALFAGSISCLLTAIAAGLLVDDPIACAPKNNSACIQLPVQNITY